MSAAASAPPSRPSVRGGHLGPWRASRQIRTGRSRGPATERSQARRGTRRRLSKAADPPRLMSVPDPRGPYRAPALQVIWDWNAATRTRPHPPTRVCVWPPCGPNADDPRKRGLNPAPNPLYLVGWLWCVSIGAGCSPRRAGLWSPVREMAWGVLPPALVGYLRPLRGTCADRGLVRRCG